MVLPYTISILTKVYKIYTQKKKPKKRKDYKMKIGLNLPHACIYVATLDIKLYGHNMDTIGYHKHIAWYHMPKHS